MLPKKQIAGLGHLTKETQSIQNNTNARFWSDLTTNTDINGINDVKRMRKVKARVNDCCLSLPGGPKQESVKKNKKPNVITI